MRLSTVGLVLSAVFGLGHAGGTGGSDWGTTTAACVPSTITSLVVTTSYNTLWSVSFQTVTAVSTQTQTVIETTTQWQVSTTTVVQPTTIVETTTKIQPTTIVDTTTQIQPTTIVETTTQIQPTTIVSTTTVVSVSASPTTVVSVSVSVSPTTVVVPTTIVSPTTVISETTVVTPTTIVTPTTLVSPTTVVSVSVSVSPTTIESPTTLISRTTVTSIDTTTATVTHTGTTTDTVTSIGVTTDTVIFTPTSNLSGLVTCTSRTINPTYTPPAPLPNNYTWGCPPGTICTPPQIGCNWEQNPPADTYVCSPDECKPSPTIPVPSDWNSTWPNPTLPNCAWYQPVLGVFHLNPEHFNLTFAIFDVYGQPTCPTASPTAWGWQDWPKPTATNAPKMPRRRSISNPLAEMFWRRQYSVAPAACYMVFDNTQAYAQSVGKVTDLLCPPTSEFMLGISACQACASANGGSSGTVDNFPDLQQYFNFCG